MPVQLLDRAEQLHQRLRLWRRRLGLGLGRVLLIDPFSVGWNWPLPCFSEPAKGCPGPAGMGQGRTFRHAGSPAGSGVRVVDYDPSWPAQYEAERGRILWLLGPRVVAVEHIGSTAVPGLGAKPCVDIQVALRDMGDVRSSADDLRWIGYRPPDLGAPDWRLVRKLAPGCHHVHLTTWASPRWQRNLLVRDYLRGHPDAARAYLRLKLDLAATCSDIRDYSEGKSGFVRGLEEDASRALLGAAPDPSGPARDRQLG